MTGLHLTPEAVQARRLELAEVDAQIRALGRRKSVLRAEILSGYAAPVKGVAAEQLPLVETATATTPATTAPEAPAQAPEAAKAATATATARTAVQQREAVLAALRAAKGRRSGKVLATLLGESEEDIHECLMELIQRGEARSARRGGYEATDKPQPQGRDTKPGKGRKKGKKEPATPPPAEIAVLGDMTMAEVRQVLLDEIGTWKRWHSGAAADQALWAELRESGHDDEDKDTFDLSRRVDEVGHEALAALATEGKIQSDGPPGRWGKSYAPLGVERTAEGGPDEPRPPRAKKTSKKASKKPASKAPAAKKTKGAAKGKKAEGTRSRTWTVAEDIEAVLREWGTWFEVGQLEAKVREMLPLSLGPSTAEWNNALRGLIEAKKIQRREVDGQVQFRLAVAPEPKKKGKKASAKAEPTPAPEPAVDWRQERKGAVAHIAEQHKAELPIGGDRKETPRYLILVYLEAAGALVASGTGWDFELSCEIDERRISEGVWRMGLDYLLDTIEESAAVNGGLWPTASSLATMLEAPRGLVDDLVAELLDLRRLREVPQTLGSPRLEVLPSPKGKKLAPAAARTAPLFDDVEPAPDVDGLEPEGDES